MTGLRPEAGVRARLRQIQTRSRTVMNICDSLQRSVVLYMSVAFNFIPWHHVRIPIGLIGPILVSSARLSLDKYYIVSSASHCSMFRIELNDSSAVLLVSTLVRSLKTRARSLLHFYSGITSTRGLPGHINF